MNLQLDKDEALVLFKIPTQNAPATDIMAKAIRDVIAPAAIAERKRVVQRNNDFAKECKGSDAPQLAEEDIRIIWSFDGELKFLDAMLDAIVDNVPEALQQMGFEILKFAAAASKTQQPLDVSTSFRALEQFVKALRSIGSAHYTDALSSHILKGMDASSLKTYVLFLSNLPDMLSKAFNKDAIKKGWSTAGFVPFDVLAILRRCTTWSQLSREQADAIIGSFPELLKHAMKKGEVDDDIMQRLVGDVINFDEWVAMHSGTPTKRGIPLELQALNRHRAVWLNHEATTKRRAEAEERKEAEAREKAELKAKKEAEHKRKAEEKEQRDLEKEAKRKQKLDAKALKEANALARAEVLAKEQQAKVGNAARKLAKVKITPIPAQVAPEPTSSGRQRKTPAKLAL